VVAGKFLGRYLEVDLKISSSVQATIPRGSCIHIGHQCVTGANTSGEGVVEESSLRVVCIMGVLVRGVAASDWLKVG
jgi:hypothetical protein